MADALETAMRFRARLLTREAEAVREMTRVYRRLLTPIDAELRTIRQRLIHARREGLDARDLLYREGRLQDLERAVRQQLTRFASAAGELALAQQQAAAAAATGEAAALIGAATPPSITLDTIRLPTGAVEALAGITRPGAPLASLLNQIAAQGATAATDALLTGIALGYNPNRTARAVRDALGVPLHRARTIARTETLRAYREAALDTYRANPEIVTGWTWLAALDRRTCASCIAQHGTEHPLDEQLASHPSCRCTQLPIVRPWRELGFPGIPEPPRMQTGPEWFARQPADVQREVLGPTLHRDFRGRRLTLPDLVDRRTHPVWGPETREATIGRARANAAARRAAA